MDACPQWVCKQPNALRCRQAVRAMLAGLDRGAYILPGPVSPNNALVTCTAGTSLLALPLALLAMLLAPLMASAPSVPPPTAS